MSDSAAEKAVLLIETFTNGLKHGVRHFDHRGREMTTVKEIITELRDHGSIHIKMPEGEEPKED